VLGAALKRLSKRDKVLKLAMIERLYPFGEFKPKWHADQYSGAHSFFFSLFWWFRQTFRTAIGYSIRLSFIVASPAFL
jgi:hypothetical protein